MRAKSMLAIVPQMRLLLAIEPVDFRNHSEHLIIPSSVTGTHRFRSNPAPFGVSSSE